MRALAGELIGTFILVFVGCGAVALAVLLDTLNLFGVALIFGCGVTLGIYASKKWSPAHLNPAVSLAFALNRKLSFQNLLLFTLGQLIGASLGGMLILVIFNSSIEKFEMLHHIVRGDANSYHSAVMFGEFFPNPAYEDELYVSHLQALFYEALGTFFLIMVIFHVHKIESMTKVPAPILIGVTIMILILFIAPYTQAGLNPARDLSPRLIASVSGWNAAAFPNPGYSFFTVYVLGPFIGSFFAVLLHRFTGN